MADMINIPDVYQEFIRPEKRTMPKNANVINLDHSDLVLSQKDALEDLETYKYLMDNAYAGRDYWSMHGVDFPACYAMIENKLKQQEYVSSTDFAQMIHDAFAGKIIDNHLGITTNRIRSGSLI